MTTVDGNFFRPADRLAHTLDQSCWCRPLATASLTGLDLVDLHHQDAVGAFLGGNWHVIFEGSAPEKG